MRLFLPGSRVGAMWSGAGVKPRHEPMRTGHRDQRGGGYRLGARAPCDSLVLGVPDIQITSVDAIHNATKGISIRPMATLRNVTPAPISWLWNVTSNHRQDDAHGQPVRPQRLRLPERLPETIQQRPPRRRAPLPTLHINAPYHRAHVPRAQPKADRPTTGTQSVSTHRQEAEEKGHVIGGKEREPEDTWDYRAETRLGGRTTTSRSPSHCSSRRDLARRVRHYHAGRPIPP